jgi:hypothetical protein
MFSVSIYTAFETADSHPSSYFLTVLTDGGRANMYGG